MSESKMSRQGFRSVLASDVSRRSMLGGGAAVLAGIALSACTGGGSGGSSGGGSGSALTLATYDDAPKIPGLKDQLAQFTKQTGIQVNVDDLPGSGAAVYPGKIRTELVGGKGPDVFRTWGGSLGGPFGTSGLAIDLSKYVQQYGWDKIMPSNLMSGMKWNGTQYGLPIYQAAIEAWYSKTAFEKAGISAPPTTYDELLAANDKLVASGQVPLATGGKYGWHLMRLFEYLLEKNAGPDQHDQLLAGKASWDDPVVVQSFTELKQWNDKGYLPKGVMAVDPTQVENTFTTGQYAYTIAGAWVDSAAVQKAKDPSAYGVFELPTGKTPARHSGFVEGYMISASSQNQDGAAKLIDFLAKPATINALQITNSTITAAQPDPSKYPLSASNAKLAASQPFFTIQDQAFPPSLADQYFQVQSQVVQGQMTPAAAAKQMQSVVPNGLKQQQ
ncbi:ABC transporter substrate-binding protein [Sinomonas terrae]|uniref:Extracellular solute-binding protein n=1 Tax=Sinomonas terrae TaxID=2908838 RepID=A0ABS9U165_9MICC|nr:extracellular solute-binding protein [Sinomonas terrae]MCH6470065.1 extracellular solute-binding protein [Sinomonas terrae]